MISGVPLSPDCHRQGRGRRLTLCPFMPGRPAVPGRPRAPWGDTGDSDGGAGGAVPTPQLPKVPKGGEGDSWGCPLVCVSPGGRGDPALQDGQACQLHPEDKDKAVVACPQARWLLLTLGGGWQDHQAPKLGGTPWMGDLHHLRSCQGGQQDLGDPWDPKREGRGEVTTVPCHPATHPGHCHGPQGRDSVVTAAGLSPSPGDVPKRCQHSQKHQVLRVHQGGLGNLEDPVEEKIKGKKKYGSENEKFGPGSPGGRGGVHKIHQGFVPTCVRKGGTPSRLSPRHLEGPRGVFVPKPKWTERGDTHGGAGRAGETTGTSWALRENRKG